MIEARTERTVGVTSELKPLQRQHLLAFLHSEVYTDVLDVMEMVCIEMETKLINTDAADHSAVLANHRMAKAAWQIFTEMQLKIADEASRHLQAVTKNPPVPQLTAFEKLVDNIVDPTNPPPDNEEWEM
jgi:hypothetical protein